MINIKINKPRMYIYIDACILIMYFYYFDNIFFKFNGRFFIST